VTGKWGIKTKKSLKINKATVEQGTANSNTPTEKNLCAAFPQFISMCACVLTLMMG
jgi:hypothetical protein